MTASEEMVSADPSISTIAVLGSGTMGRGIAQVAAMVGYRTRLYDPDGEALTAGMKAVVANLSKGVARGKVTSEVQSLCLGNLESTSDFVHAIGGAELIIEAVPE